MVDKLYIDSTQYVVKTNPINPSVEPTVVTVAPIQPAGTGDGTPAAFAGARVLEEAAAMDTWAANMAQAPV